MDMTDRKFTWKKQPEDLRDYSFRTLFRSQSYTIVGLPKVANNRKWCSYVDDQGNLGSCTANAWASLLEYNICKSKGGKYFRDLSRLFIYYNERALEGNVYEDCGAYLRSGAKVLASQGVCEETQHPYLIEDFAKKPSDDAYTIANKNKIVGYYTLRTLTEMKTCIANGQCFVFGFLVFSNFENDKVYDEGILDMPVGSDICLGGHAVMAVGYNDYEERFLIKNSWGKGWGLKGKNSGYFTMPYEYISNHHLAGDFWTVSL
jgi:C1A family cysteine protease